MRYILGRNQLSFFPKPTITQKFLESMVKIYIKEDFKVENEAFNVLYSALNYLKCPLTKKLYIIDLDEINEDVSGRYQYAVSENPIVVDKKIHIISIRNIETSIHCLDLNDYMFHLMHEIMHVAQNEFKLKTKYDKLPYYTKPYEIEARYFSYHFMNLYLTQIAKRTGLQSIMYVDIINNKYEIDVDITRSKISKIKNKELKTFTTNEEFRLFVLYYKISSF